MQKMLLLGLMGGIAYWMFFRKSPPEASGQPAQTTGAPQPQGIQAYPRAIADVYDLSAYPMGTFADRR